MKKFSILLLAVVLFCITIQCKKDKENMIQENKCELFNDYFDSTYFSFNQDSIKFFYKYLSNNGTSIEPIFGNEPISKNDSVTIGFSISSINDYKLSIEIFYKIREKDLRESDTSSKLDILKVSNFDTLIKVGKLDFRNDFINPINKVGIQISYIDSFNYLNTTNVREDMNLNIPKDMLDLKNTYCVIEQRQELCNGSFLIKGNFEAVIYIAKENKFSKLTNGKFCILVHH